MRTDIIVRINGAWLVDTVKPVKLSTCYLERCFFYTHCSEIGFCNSNLSDKLSTCQVERIVDRIFVLNLDRFYCNSEVKQHVIFIFRLTTFLILHILRVNLWLEKDLHYWLNIFQKISFIKRLLCVSSLS